MTEVKPESVALEVVTSLPGDVQAHLDRAQDLREESARTQTEAAAEVRAAARELAATGLPQREVGALLEVSRASTPGRRAARLAPHQRAHQLLATG